MFFVSGTSVSHDEVVIKSPPWGNWSWWCWGLQILSPWDAETRSSTWNPPRLSRCSIPWLYLILHSVSTNFYSTYMTSLAFITRLSNSPLILTSHSNASLNINNYQYSLVSVCQIAFRFTSQQGVTKMTLRESSGTASHILELEQCPPCFDQVMYCVPPTNMTLSTFTTF